MTDVIGNEIEVNDKVLYTLSGRGEEYLYTGIIVEIQSTAVKILSNNTKRVITRNRLGFVKI